jgi:hypothetical protein
MKLVFFHNSYILIEKFLPRSGDDPYNFFWVDNKYHDYTSLEEPLKYIHFFVRDPWKEGYDFTLMQGIGKSSEALRSYYMNWNGSIGTAPILRIADNIVPDLIAVFDEEKKSYQVVGTKRLFKVNDANDNLVPFVQSKVLRDLVPTLTQAFPITE